MLGGEVPGCPAEICCLGRRSGRRVSGSVSGVRGVWARQGVLCQMSLCLPNQLLVPSFTPPLDMGCQLLGEACSSEGFPPFPVIPLLIS